MDQQLRLPCFLLVVAYHQNGYPKSLFKKQSVAMAF